VTAQKKLTKRKRDVFVNGNHQTKKLMTDKEKNKEKENEKAVIPDGFKSAPKMPSKSALEKRYRDELLAKGFDTLSTYTAALDQYAKNENRSKAADSTFFPFLCNVVSKKLKMTTVVKPPVAKPFVTDLYKQLAFGSV